jgi:hypothetical protein
MSLEKLSATLNLKEENPALFGRITEDEIKHLRNAIIEILIESEDCITPIPILPIYFKLFSAGFPFILWCEFLYLAKHGSPESLGTSSKTIWDNLRKVARLNSYFGEIYEVTPCPDDNPLPRPPNLINCGISYNLTVEKWTEFMMAHTRRTSYQWAFSSDEIFGFIYTLMRSINKCLKEPTNGDDQSVDDVIEPVYEYSQVVE